MADRSDSPRSLAPILVLALLPIGLGAGWLVGKIPGEAPPPKPVQVGVKHTAESVRAAATPPPAEASAGDRAAESPVSTSASAPVSSPWMSYDAAVAESNRTGKPILLDFNAEWCPPCQALKREVFDDGSYGPEIQLAVIPVSVVDRTREEGTNPADIESLQRRFDVEAFPTLVVFHPGTGRKVVARGFGGAERTATWIREAAKYVK